MDYPKFTLHTKHGDFLVTVLDPTPTDEDIRRGGGTDNEVVRIDGSATINRVPVEVHASYKRFVIREVHDWAQRKGLAVGSFYPQYTGYGIRRADGSFADVPPGVRSAVDAIAVEAVNTVTDSQLREARKVRLLQEAEWERRKAEDLRKKAARHDATAEKKEAEAATL